MTQLDDKKKKQLELVITKLEKEYGKGAVTLNSTIEGVEFYKTGINPVDKILGGGFGKGRIVEIVGMESSGKSTLAYHVIAEAQKNGLVCAYVDVEHALDPSYMQNLGVQLDQLLISQPESAEQAWNILEAFVSSGAIDIVILDSVAALVSQKELDGEVGDAHVGLIARMMGQGLRKITGAAHKNECTVIFINQFRSNMNAMAFQSNKTATGGNALKYFASQRIEVIRTGSIKKGHDETAEVLGNKTTIKVIKNKLAPPFKEADVVIKFGIGVDKNLILLEEALEKGVISKNGAWYRFKDNNFAQGADKATEYFQANPEFKAEIERLVNEHS